MNKFICINEVLPALNSLCECKTKVNSIIKARLVQNHLKTEYYWIMDDGSFIISPESWRYIHKSYKIEADIWFIAQSSLKKFEHVYYKTDDGKQVNKVDNINFEIVNDDLTIIPVKTVKE